MKFLARILLVVMVSALLLPHGHAGRHEDHHPGAGLELSEVTSEPCACHACEEEPCTADVQIQLHRSCDTVALHHHTVPAWLLVLPETKPDWNKTTPPVPGVLASLRTVQLLI